VGAHYAFTQEVRPTAPAEKWQLGLALAVVLCVALVPTARPIFDPAVQALYRENPDSKTIARQAAEATPSTVASWWHGDWIESDSMYHYYRPLSSMLLWLEYVAFGFDFQKYCLVSWFLHALACVALFFWVRRLLGSGASALIFAVLAVALFSVPSETADAGPHWGNRGIARGVMPWFPAQTDIASLSASLTALILLDLYLQRGRRGWLIGSLGLYLTALGFKETPLCLPLVTACLVLYRRPTRRVALLALGLQLLVALAFFGLRELFVPYATGPRDIEIHYLGKMLYYLCEPAMVYWTTGAYWGPIAAVGAVGLGWLLHWRRVEPPWILLAVLVWVFGVAALVGGNIAQPTTKTDAWWLSRIALTALFFSGAFVWRKRSPALMLLGALVAVHLPIVHVTGPHYYYWVVAWWGAFNATVLWTVWCLVAEKRAARPVQAVPTQT